MQSERDHLIRFAFVAELACGTGHRGVGLLRAQHDTISTIGQVKFPVLIVGHSENSETTFADVIVSFGFSLTAHVDREVEIFGIPKSFGSCKTAHPVVGVGPTLVFLAATASSAS